LRFHNRTVAAHLRVQITNHAIGLNGKKIYERGKLGLKEDLFLAKQASRFGMYDWL
jgi:hypothetical protein